MTPTSTYTESSNKHHGGGWRFALVAFAVLGGALLTTSSGAVEGTGAKTVAVQGSTTFHNRILQPNLAAIEAASGGVYAWLENLQNVLDTGRPFSESHELDDGRTVLVNTQPLADGGWVDLHEDITEKRASEAQIAKLARFDTLTGLANRHHFQENLNQALLGLDTFDRFAILWFDLDRFKTINDTLGHPAGDEVLKSVADRLRVCVRDTDFVARLGGDEFAIIISGPGVVERDAAQLADRLLRKLSAPYEIFDKVVSIGVSIGIAVAPGHGTNAEDLIKHADIALYQAKARGRGMFVVFNSNLETEITARDRAEVDLRRAIAANELLLHYQPILDVKTGKVKSCEALMRWQHPTRGMVSPAEFIPLAEEIGLIEVMGEWAIQKACHDAAAWPGGIKVAVNLAATQLTSSEVVKAVANALAKSGLPASRLELEVTETIMLKDNASTIEALQALRGMGVTIALDDFGTGYASLSYLRSFPFDKLKIDQCFVKEIASRDDCFAIVKTVVSLARSLGMSSVAEGIETPEILERVISAGCDELQGYLFSRPVSATDLRAALQRAEECRAMAA